MHVFHNTSGSIVILPAHDRDLEWKWHRQHQRCSCHLNWKALWEVQQHLCWKVKKKAQSLVRSWTGRHEQGWLSLTKGIGDGSSSSDDTAVTSSAADDSRKYQTCLRKRSVCLRRGGVSHTAAMPLFTPVTRWRSEKNKVHMGRRWMGGWMDEWVKHRTPRRICVWDLLFSVFSRSV